jgi:hypothetical protein
MRRALSLQASAGGQRYLAKLHCACCPKFGPRAQCDERAIGRAFACLLACARGIGLVRADLRKGCDGNNFLTETNCFAFAEKFINGYAIVCDRDADYGVINESGKWVINPLYSYLKNCNNGFFVCAFRSDNEDPEFPGFFYIDKAGREYREKK